MEHGKGSLEVAELNFNRLNTYLSYGRLKNMKSMSHNSL